MPPASSGNKKKKSGSSAKTARRAPQTLEEFFGPDGPLAEVLPDYEQRGEQVEVSRAIADALQLGRPCLAEAGTGVGKTMAYLVPVVQAALAGKRTVISTHTINLQSQLVIKDIPLVISMVPGAKERVHYEVMKGRGNYLCKLALEQSKDDLFLAGDPHFRKVQAWSRRPDCSGDIADLPFTFSAWQDLTSLPETCTGQQCDLYETCHLYNMRRRAAESNIIVVNHALFFSDLALQLEDPNAGVLPAYDYVIFDEAHHLEDVATRTFGLEFGSRRIANLIDRIKRIKELDVEPERLASLDQLNSQLFAPFHQSGKMEFTLEEALRPEIRPDVEKVVQLTCNAVSELKNYLQEAGKENEVIKDRVDGLSKLCERAQNELDRLFFKTDENAVRWGEVELSKRATAPESRVSLHLTPIDVAKVLGTALWERMELLQGSAVLVSATLANSGGFSYQRARLGVPDNAIECLVGSPFDFKKQALLYVPAHLPAPAPGTEYADLVAKEIMRVITLTEGRAFLLFTSRFMLNAIHDRLSGTVPFPLFKQGDLPPGKLVAEFKKSGNGCLFGLQTFWEGVDVQGAALTCVIIDRLPFAVPDSPITRARTRAISDSGGDWFNEYSVPQAQIRLKQGFGRLIRTHTDTGIVCILDTRLLTRNYGPDFVKYLPQAARASKWNRVERFYATVNNITSPNMNSDEPPASD